MIKESEKLTDFWKGATYGILASIIILLIIYIVKKLKSN